MLQPVLATLPLVANLVLFVLAAAAAWAAGTRLSLYAEEISDRKRIGKALMGLIFLAGITSLPEVVTTITGALENNAPLVLNNLFGGIALQTAILAAADAAARGAPLTLYPRKVTPALEACFLVLLLSLVQAITLVGEQALIAGIGTGTIVLAVAYMATIYLLRTSDETSVWTPVHVAEEFEGEGPAQGQQKLAGVALRRLWLLFTATALAVLVVGVMLVQLSETIAAQSGLGASFIGVTLLAASTSLPELSTTVAAVRLGSYTMAISNIFGSNLIMLALLLPADLFYRPGPILADVDRSASFAISAGLIVTTVYLIGLVTRYNRRVLGMGLDSLVVLACYVLSLAAFYHLR